MPLTPTFIGFIPETRDAYLLLHAALDGRVPMVVDRVAAGMFHMIRSGAVFIFNARSIQRWTDGRKWSPSRELGNFYVYREINAKVRLTPESGSSEAPVPIYHSPKRLANIELNLYGSLDPSYDIKLDGLVKRTISMPYNNEMYRLVCYYNVEDVLSHKLITPLDHPALLDSLAFTSPRFHLPPMGID